MVALPAIFSSFLPASWNGLQFFVLAAETRAGQRAYTHSYPFNDQPYTEPLGRSARQYVITGYLVGDDLNQQYSSMLDAIESKAPGQLIHPSLGAFQVVCLQAECTQTTAARYVEIKFTFVEAGSPIFPTSGIDSQQRTIDAASNGQDASQQGFSTSLGNAGNGNESSNGGFNAADVTTATGSGVTGAGASGQSTTQIPTAAIEQTNTTSNDSVIHADIELDYEPGQP